MEFKNMFGDDRAVSPVIGVILMVAITVILAAVIGTFVLGLGDQIQQTTPQASFGFDTSDGQNQVTVTHETGDSVASPDLKLVSTVEYNDSNSGGAFGTSSSATWEAVTGSGADVTAGSSATITANGTDTFAGETVRVVFDSPDSDTTATLAKFEVPE